MRKERTKSKKRITNEVLDAKLNHITDWMSNHDTEDNQRFTDVDGNIAKLATKEDMTEAVQVVARAFDDHSKLDKEWKDNFAAEMKPVISIYKGSVFTKSFVIGIASVIGAIVGIGYGLITLVGWLTHGSK